MTSLSDDFITAILDGDLDGDLDRLTAAIRDRKQTVAARVRYQVRPGDTVRFSDVIRPRYLVGLTATVTRANPKSIVVSCPQDSAYGRFAGAQNVRCPLELIEGKVE